MTPKTPQAWQKELDRFYRIILKVADKEDRDDWKKAVSDLRTIRIIKAPKWLKWFKAIFQKKFCLNATTSLPPILSDKIYLYDRYWTLDDESKSSILIHEWTHWVQGKMKSPLNNLEREIQAEGKEQEFRRYYRKHKGILR